MISRQTIPVHRQFYRTVVDKLRTRLNPQATGFQYTVAALLGIAAGIGAALVASYSMNMLLFLGTGAALGVVALTALLAGSLEKLLLGVIVLDLSIGFDVYLNYRDSVGTLGGVGGLNVSLTSLALLALYASWFLRRATTNDSRFADRPVRLVLRQSLISVPFLFFVTLSLFSASDVQLSLFKLVSFFQVFLTFLYLLHSLQNAHDVRTVFVFLLLGFILQCGIMLLSAYGGLALSFPGVSTSVQSGIGDTAYASRIAGTLGSPNAAAAFISLLLTPTASLLITRERAIHKVIGTLAFLLGSIALVLTLSRGGWIAFGLSMILFCFAGWRRRWLSPVVLVAGGIIALIVVLFAQQTIMARIFGEDAGSVASRAPLTNLAFEIIADQPLLGVGTNNYAAVIDDYLSPRYSGDWIRVVHNQYLLVWAESGIGALLTFIFFLLATVYRGWQCWRARDRLLSPIALALALALLGHMVHMNFDFFNHPTLVLLLWFSAGLVSSIHLILVGEAANKPSVLIREGSR